MEPFIIFGAALLLLGAVVKKAINDGPAGLGESGGGSALNARPGPVVDAAIRAEAALHPGIPLAFFMACAALESRFNPGVRRFDSVERSVGLYQINLNAHGGTLSQLGISADDLYDPRVNVKYWASHIVERLAARADRDGYEESGNPSKWEAVRSWLASSRFDPRNTSSGAWRYIERFRPIYSAWKTRV